MTIQFIEEIQEYVLFLNVSNLVSGVNQIKITSQASNTTILDTTFTIGETNDRYTRIDFEIPQIQEEHLNSIADYTVIVDEVVQDTGIIKVTTIPGGGTYTQNYVSNNEERQSKIYYRPNY